MKFWRTTILIFAFFLSFGLKAQNLQKTVEKYCSFLIRIDLDKEDFLRKLKIFIDPEINRDSFCNEYYKNWHHRKEQIGYSKYIKISNISYTSDSTATVEISDLWAFYNGEKYEFIADSFWIKKRNKWCRSAEPAVTKSKNELNEFLDKKL
jgi:hypothetical protein